MSKLKGREMIEMTCCNECKNYKRKQLRPYAKIWEVCTDFSETKGGAMPIWLCLFIPFIAPIIYLGCYYMDRWRK